MFDVFYTYIPVGLTFIVAVFALLYAFISSPFTAIGLTVILAIYAIYLIVIAILAQKEEKQWLM